MLTRALDLPDFRDFARARVEQRATERIESTRQLGELMREVYRRNPTHFRLFCPDETNTNRLGAVFDVSDRAFMERVTEDDVKISARTAGSWRCCQRAQLPRLAGGLHADRPARPVRHLRGVRDGVGASQTIQHGKWLQEASHLPWRADVPSLNMLLTSTAWRNDHNGFSHQGPGLIQTVLTSAATSPGSTCRRTPTACCRWPTTASAVTIRQPDRAWTSSRSCSG